MKPWVARSLTSLHSPGWRARYGSEFEALLVDLPASPATLADVAASIVASRRIPLIVSLCILTIVTSIFLSLATHDVAPSTSLSQHLEAPPPVCIRFSHIRKTRPCVVG